MFDWFKKKTAKPKRVVEHKLETAKAPESTPKPVAPSEKDLATEQGEPWVQVLRIDVDPNNLHQGAFELDWNDKFVANLIRAGYQIRKDDTDADIVDRWFQNVCRHVVMETWEQEQAIKTGYIQERNLGNGRSEVR